MTTRSRVPDRDPSPNDIAALDAAALSSLLEEGAVSSREVTEALLDRIEALDSQGASIRSVIELAPNALEVADALDAERRSGVTRSPLHGVPVLVKDNIDTAYPLHTTAGSLVFGDCAPAFDATLVTSLREAGMVILGKTNLSEWSYFRGKRASSGWSAVRGQTRNPHVLDRSPGGSSSGSGAAVAARFSPIAIGTETNGSILCPSAACGVFGLKPTVGLISRTGIVPVALSHDTAGPMARTTKDLALLLEVLANANDDGEDHRTRAAIRPQGHSTNYADVLDDGDVSALRIGVVRDEEYVNFHPTTDRAYADVLSALVRTGAHIVDPVCGLRSPLSWSEDKLTVFSCEFRAGIEAYFARRAHGRPDCVHLPLTLGDVLAHARAEPREQTDIFDTGLITLAAATDGVVSENYMPARDRLGGAARENLDRLFSEHGVDVLVLPAMPPAWPVDHLLGDRPHGPGGWSPAAVAGYPSATLPMGGAGALPVGLVLMGRPWSEATLLRAMAALERELGPGVTRPLPTFLDSVSDVTVSG